MPFCNVQWPRFLLARSDPGCSERMFVVSLTTSRKMQELYLKLHHKNFPPHPFHFIFVKGLFEFYLLLAVEGFLK
jgi:hypothetical protein